LAWNRVSFKANFRARANFSSAADLFIGSGNAAAAHPDPTRQTVAVGRRIAFGGKSFAGEGTAAEANIRTGTDFQRGQTPSSGMGIQPQHHTNRAPPMKKPVPSPGRGTPPKQTSERERIFHRKRECSRSTPGGRCLLFAGCCGCAAAACTLPVGSPSPGGGFPPKQTSKRGLIFSGSKPFRREPACIRSHTPCERNRRKSLSPLKSLPPLWFALGKIPLPAKAFPLNAICCPAVVVCSSLDVMGVLRPHAPCRWEASRQGEDPHRSKHQNGNGSPTGSGNAADEHPHPTRRAVATG
jgi:hypothetical protein